MALEKYKQTKSYCFDMQQISERVWMCWILRGFEPLKALHTTKKFFVTL